jgi:hypothetical protein
MTVRESLELCKLTMSQSVAGGRSEGFPQGRREGKRLNKTQLQHPQTRLTRHQTQESHNDQPAQKLTMPADDEDNEPPRRPSQKQQKKRKAPPFPTTWHLEIGRSVPRQREQQRKDWKAAHPGQMVPAMLQLPPQGGGRMRASGLTQEQHDRLDQTRGAQLRGRERQKFNEEYSDEELPPDLEIRKSGPARNQDVSDKDRHRLDQKAAAQQLVRDRKKWYKANPGKGVKDLPDHLKPRERWGQDDSSQDEPERPGPSRPGPYTYEQQQPQPGPSRPDPYTYEQQRSEVPWDEWLTPDHIPYLLLQPLHVGPARNPDVSEQELQELEETKKRHRRKQNTEEAQRRRARNGWLKANPDKGVDDLPDNLKPRERGRPRRPDDSPQEEPERPEPWPSQPWQRPNLGWLGWLESERLDPGPSRSGPYIDDQQQQSQFGRGERRAQIARRRAEVQDGLTRWRADKETARQGADERQGLE